MQQLDPDATVLPRRDRIARIGEAAIIFVSIPALSLFIMSIVTFIWGGVKVWKFVELLFDDGVDAPIAVVRLLQAIDVYLLGTVLLILALGFIELFVTPLRLPGWLVIKNLADLKGKLVDVIQVVAAIKFLEKLVLDKDALDVLWYGIAVSLLIGALLAVRWVGKQSH